MDHRQGFLYLFTVIQLYFTFDDTNCLWNSIQFLKGIGLLGMGAKSGAEEMLEPTTGLPWYALKVRTNGESKSNLALITKGYETFLPTYIDVRRYSDRLKKVPAALFPGYLFCRLDVEYRLPILTTSGVESIVGIGGEPLPIEEEEIRVIRKVVHSGVEAIPWPYLKEGDRVRVQFGSLTGVEGTLIKVRGAARLVISIHFLQRSISFEVDREWVRPL